MSQRKTPAKRKPARQRGNPAQKAQPVERHPRRESATAAFAREEEEQRAAEAGQAAPPPELRPHKIVGQLIGARFDEHGEIVGEEVMGEVVLYKPHFGKLPQMIDDAVKVAKERNELDDIAQAARAEE
jgi:hypothetical protein